MPHRDPEAARAKARERWIRLKKLDPDYSKRQYRENREKRLAEASAKYWADPEKGRELSRAVYAKHKEKRAADAREYRRRKREEVNAKAKAKYHANREVITERRKGYKVDIDARRAYFRERRRNHPEEALLGDAKRAICEQTGVQFRDIPDDMAAAKAEQLRLVRLLRELRPR